MGAPIQARTQEHGQAGAASRAPAPDLARGFMLLAIAFAHAPLFVTAVGHGSEVANKVVEFFHLLFVNNHARPMFAFLFGYSLVQLLNSRTRRGADWVTARKLLRRRGWWLVAIGFVHVALLVPIDILAPYGLTAVLVAGMLRRQDSTILWTAAISLVPATALVGASMWFPLAQGRSTFTAGSVAAGTKGLGELFVARLTGWPFGLLIGVVLVVPAVLLGIWAARRRLLEEPERHRRFLVRFTVIATAVSVAGSVPTGLIRAGLWTDPSGAASWPAVLAQPLTGYFGGIAMAGVVALLAPLAVRRRGRLTTAVQALGRRSMSMYLFQSVVFVAAFSPFGLGLQDDLGLAGATGVAAATWLVSLAIADLMRRTGHRGPAEVLLRRLAYRDPRPVTGSG
ncbi:DUF418 domain-containing protein [Nonomuraea indica]|uniref:DUF418 domain-containing protein n=1 Tax=Nonomuraea indica TaxID=1581193 RepID=UPI0031836E59